MGGGALGKTAARPTSAEFEEVRKYLKNALQPYFGPVETPPYLTTKFDHGDIDTLCGYSGIGWGKVKVKQGRSEGRVGENEGANAVMGHMEKEGGCTVATGGHDLHAQVANLTIDVSSGPPGFTDPTDGVPTMKINDGPADTTPSSTKPVYKAPDYISLATNPPTGETLVSLLTAAGVADITMDAPAEKLRTWCEIIVRHLGGTHWLFLGRRMISFAFPVALVHAIIDAQPTPKLSKSEEAAQRTRTPAMSSRDPPTETTANHISQAGAFSDLAATSFIQVDLMLIPPEAVAFQQFSYGYSATTLLMSQLVRRASGCRDLIFHPNHLALRWTPYPGCPRVEITLTHNVDDLCDYLGLDLGKWKNVVFDADQDLFAWFADCAEDSRAAHGLRQMSRFGVVSDTYDARYGKNSRMAMLDQFGAWLRERGWSDDQAGQRDPANATPAPSATPRQDLPVDDVHKIPKLEPTAPKLHPVHPDEPRPLPSAHAELLRIWDKEAEYAAAVVQLQEKAASAWRGYLGRKEREEREKLAMLEVAPSVGQLGDGSSSAEGDVPTANREARARQQLSLPREASWDG